MRDSQHIADAVRAIASPILRALSLELVDIICAGRGNHLLVRVFIDKPGGVTVGDCEQAHVSIGHALDVEDPISSAYTLEVSSPGLDRPLKVPSDFERCLGKRVRIKLNTPLNGQWVLVTQLLSVDDAGIMVIVTEGKTKTQSHLKWEVIAEARLEIDF